MFNLGTVRNYIVLLDRVNYTQTKGVDCTDILFFPKASEKTLVYAEEMLVVYITVIISSDINE